MKLIKAELAKKMKSFRNEGLAQNITVPRYPNSILIYTVRDSFLFSGAKVTTNRNKIYLIALFLLLYVPVMVYLFWPAR